MLTAVVTYKVNESVAINIIPVVNDCLALEHQIFTIIVRITIVKLIALV